MADEDRPETIDETFERVEVRALGEREKRREKPLTDEELATIERLTSRNDVDAVGLARGDLMRLVAEVYRLRAAAKVRVETERYGFTADAAVSAVVGSAFQQQEVDRLRVAASRLDYHHKHDGYAISTAGGCATCEEHDRLAEALRDGKA